MASQPSKGQTIKTMGIVSLFCCQIIMGPVVWNMARNEIAAIDAGLAPEEGRQPAKTGMTLAMVATALGVLGLLSGCIAGMLGGFAGILGGS